MPEARRTTMERGPEVEVVLRDVAFGGSGVGNLPDGRVVFIPRTLSGEKVRARVVREKKGYAEAELVEVLEPSPKRIAPICPVFGRCGGCAYQHADYAEQVRIKVKQVRDTLERIGGLKDLPEVRAEAAATPYGYRNKITVHGGTQGEIGFFGPDGRTVVDVARCAIANPAVNDELHRLRRSGRRPRHAAIEDSEARAGSPEGSFHQVNTEMAGRLLAWAREQFAGAGTPRLLDAYCGAGFFAFGLGDLFAEVCGLDRDTRAVAAATARAAREKRENLRFFAAPVEERLGWFFEGEQVGKTSVLVDPPREGLEPATAEALAKSGAPRLVYISCNPSTLARDLKKLAGEGGPYRVASLAAFDMFPQTASVEAGARLDAR